MADQYDKRASARRQALLALLSGTVAEPAAGLAGLYGLATGGVSKGVQNIEATREALTYHPRDASALEAVGRAVEPVTGRLQKLRDYLGDKTLAHTGSPALATAGYMVPDTLLTLLGARGMGVKGPKLAQMLERSEGPVMGSPVSQIGAIRAYHGSPHDFDRFSMEHIGTGEGAQAYGHGLYFAGAKDVAESYRKTLAGDAFVTGDGELFHPGGLRHLNVRAMARRGDIDGAIAKAAEIEKSDSPVAHLAQSDRLTLEEIKAKGGIRPNDGRLYEAELAPDETDLLDWDAPLSQQPVNVQQAIAQTISSGKLDADALREIQAAHPDALTGKKLYTILQQSDHINNAAGASEHLRNLGIPGIRYLDGGSRAAAPRPQKAAWGTQAERIDLGNGEEVRVQPWEQGIGYGDPVKREILLNKAGEGRAGRLLQYYDDINGHGISDIHVTQSMRRKGIGSKLMDAAFNATPDAEHLKILTGLSGDGRALMTRYGLADGDIVPRPPHLKTDSRTRNYVMFDDSLVKIKGKE